MSKEIDALIAKHIMGYVDLDGFLVTPEYKASWEHLKKVAPDKIDPDWPSNTTELVPPYSTDIAAAWSVLIHLCHPSSGMEWELCSDVYEGFYNCRVAWLHDHGKSGWVREATTPLAICKAALIARGIEVSDA